MWNGMTNRASRLFIRNSIFLLLILAGSAAAIGAMANGYSGRMKGLSGQIVLRAEQLRNATDGPTYDFREAEEILSELKGLIKQCEEAMVFAQSPYPGEILLGTTPAGDSTWLETLCSRPYNRPIREIRLRRTGREASYVRINDIEVTHLTPEGMKKELFNIDGRLKLYHDGVCRIPLPRPMRIVHIRILIDHESAGLKVYGVY